MRNVVLLRQTLQEKKRKPAAMNSNNLSTNMASRQADGREDEKQPQKERQSHNTNTKRPNIDDKFEKKKMKNEVKCHKQQAAKMNAQMQVSKEKRR